MTPASAASQGLAETFRQRLEGEIDPQTVVPMLGQQDLSFVLLDVRELASFEEEHVRGALHVPLAELQDRLAELPEDRTILVYSYDHACLRSTRAALVLAEQGLDVKVVRGGFAGLRANGAQVTSLRPPRVPGLSRRMEPPEAAARHPAGPGVRPPMHPPEPAPPGPDII